MESNPRQEISHGERQDSASDRSRVDLWKSKIATMKLDARAATEALGLPSEKALDVMAVMVEVSMSSETAQQQRAMQFVDRLRAQVEEMESEASKVASDSHVTNGAALEALYGLTGLGIVDLYRSEFPKVRNETT